MEGSNYWSRMTKATMSRRALIRSAAVVGATAAGAALAGCGGGNGENTAPLERTAPPEGTPRRGGTLRIGVALDLVGLDPHLGVMQTVGSRIHGHLFTISFKDQSMLMELAESFEQPDETTYVWKLRPGVKFQDIDPTFGREVTAEDVVYSMERRRDDPGQADKELLQDLTAGFEAVDRYTFRFRTRQPYSPTLSELGDLSYAVVPREAVEKWGDLHVHAAGCGGYILKEFMRGERVEMVRNPDFFMPGRPYLDAMEWLVIPDEGSLLEAFKTGRLDANPGAGAATLDKIRIDELLRIDGISVVEEPNLYKPTLLLKSDRPPFNDIRVRQALDLALDRNDLIERMFFGDALLDGPLVWGLEYWALPQAELRDFYRYDPEEAKQLLSAAGYGDGLDVETNLANLFYISEMATVVKEYFAKVGVRCNLELQELGTWLAETMIPGNFGMTWCMNLPYEEPDKPLGAYFSRGRFGGQNPTGYNNPKMDEWIWKERSEFDPEKRRKIVLDAQREALRDHGLQINACSPRTYGAHWDRVKGGDPYLGRWDYLGLDVWMT